MMKIQFQGPVEHKEKRSEDRPPRDQHKQDSLEWHVEDSVQLQTIYFGGAAQLK